MAVILLVGSEKDRAQGIRALLREDGHDVVWCRHEEGWSGEETDSRRGDIRVRCVELPDEAARAAVATAERWGMIFAAVDFMVDARTGRHIILECNSAPFFVNFERFTGLPITSRLAAYLARERR